MSQTDYHLIKDLKKADILQITEAWEHCLPPNKTMKSHDLCRNLGRRLIIKYVNFNIRVHLFTLCIHTE